MNEQEAVAYIEEWDVTEAAKVLKWYEEDKLLRPCDCDTIAAIETEDLRAENAKLRELVAEMFNACPMCVNCAHNHLTVGWYERIRELGVEVD